MKTRIVKNLFLFICAIGLACCSADSVPQDVADLHNRMLTVDTHADTPFLLGFFPDYDIGQYHPPATASLQVDFPRMKAGGLDAIFLVAFVFQGDRTAEGNQKAREKALEKIALIREAVENNSGMAQLAWAPMAESLQLPTESFTKPPK